MIINYVELAYQQKNGFNLYKFVLVRHCLQLIVLLDLFIILQVKDANLAEEMMEHILNALLKLHIGVKQIMGAINVLKQHLYLIE